ncbi:MAG: hypothetical protein ACHP65_01570 [Legionellales bacterium]
MDVSKFLSKVLGIYLLIVSSIMLVNMHQFLNNVNLLIHDAPLMFVTGFFTVVLGVLMVVSHNIWQNNWRLLITLLAWMSLFKGICLLMCPNFINSVSTLFTQNTTTAYLSAAVDLFLGILLGYFGFRK